MSRQLTQRLVDRLLADPWLRSEFARDPLAVAKRMGIDVDDEPPGGQSRSLDAPDAAARDGR